VLGWVAKQNVEPRPTGLSGPARRHPRGRGGRFGPPEVLPGVTPGEFRGGLAALQDRTVLFAWSAEGRSRGPAPGARFSTVGELDVEGLYPLIASVGRRAVRVWNPVSGDQVGVAGSARLP
jgi:hypothetical protein